MDKLGLTASVYKKSDQGVYYCKIHFAIFGMYISGITVRESPKYPEKGLWVQMPYYGNFKSYIEFSKDSKLHPVIRDKVLKAVDDFETDSTTDLDIIDLGKTVDEIFPDEK